MKFHPVLHRGLLRNHTKKEKVLASVVELQSHTVLLRIDSGLLVSQKLKTTAIGPIILKPKKIEYMGTLSLKIAEITEMSTAH